MRRYGPIPGKVPRIYPTGYSHANPRYGARGLPKNRKSKDPVDIKDHDRLITLINSYIQKFRNKNWTPNIPKIKKALGWADSRWEMFIDEFGDELQWGFISNPEVANAADELRQSIEARGVKLEDVAMAVNNHDKQLKGELRCLGLTNTEAEACVAGNNFVQNRFADMMQMVSSSVFSAASKLRTQQNVLESRIKLAVKKVAEFGPFQSPERSEWLLEENQARAEYIKIGKLLNEMQGTFHQGAAQLALVRMRLRETSANGNGQITQRSGKPGFRPVVMDAEEMPKPEPKAILDEPDQPIQPEQPVQSQEELSHDDKGTDQAGDATAAP